MIVLCTVDAHEIHHTRVVIPKASLCYPYFILAQYIKIDRKCSAQTLVVETSYVGASWKAQGLSPKHEDSLGNSYLKRRSGRLWSCFVVIHLHGSSRVLFSQLLSTAWPKLQRHLPHAEITTAGEFSLPHIAISHLSRTGSPRYLAPVVLSNASSMRSRLCRARHWITKRTQPLQVRRASGWTYAPQYHEPMPRFISRNSRKRSANWPLPVQQRDMHHLASRLLYADGFQSSWRAPSLSLLCRWESTVWQHVGQHGCTMKDRSMFRRKGKILVQYFSYCSSRHSSLTGYSNSRHAKLSQGVMGSIAYEWYSRSDKVIHTAWMSSLGNGDKSWLSS